MRVRAGASRIALRVDAPSMSATTSHHRRWLHITENGRLVLQESMSFRSLVKAAGYSVCLLGDRTPLRFASIGICIFTGNSEGVGAWVTATGSHHDDNEYNGLQTRFSVHACLKPPISLGIIGTLCLSLLHYVHRLMDRTVQEIPPDNPQRPSFLC